MGNRTYKTLTWEKRLQIEALHNAGLKPKEIAEQIGVHISTIYREISRGKTTQRNSDWTERKIYSPNLAQDRVDKNKKERGRPLKIGNDHVFVKYVEDMIINKHYSPEAVLADIKRKGLDFDTKICLSTLYNYIRKGVFLNITMVDCPYHKEKKKQKKKKVQKKVSKGTSIEQRPKEVMAREEFGHWEMDTVVSGQGKSKKSLLVLTERKTRKEIIEVLKSHTMKEVVRVLDKIERKVTEKVFRVLFKTITVDNGTEFSDWRGMKRSRRNARDRTEIYYCHAYCSWERGTNENQNRLVRRWKDKGCSFDDITNKEVKQIEQWMNDYPRKMFDYQTSEELFLKEVRDLQV